MTEQNETPTPETDAPPTAQGDGDPGETMPADEAKSDGE